MGTAQIFSEHAGYVWRSLRRLGVPYADADDAVQEVFLVVHRRIAEYEERGRARAWLLSISRQVSSNYHRATKRLEQRQRQLVLDVGSHDLEEVVARREAARIVHAFIRELHERQRQVFYLSDVEGLSPREIGARLGVNQFTVYGRLRAARQSFEVVLEKLAHPSRAPTSSGRVTVSQLRQEQRAQASRQEQAASPK